MMTVSQLLAAAFDLAPLDRPPAVIPGGAVCAFSGAALTEGYRLADCLGDVGGTTYEQFAGNVTGWVSDATARCFKSANPHAGSNPLARSLAVFAGPDGTVEGRSPMIARESAAKGGRPCWSDMVREVWPARRGHTCLWALTTDNKRRVWPAARTGTLGAATPVLYYDNDTNGQRVLTVDWPDMLRCLDMAEAIYTAGFGKPSIRGGLLSNQAAVQKVGMGQALRWERALAPWRSRPEFAVAALIAQKRGDAA